MSASASIKDGVVAGIVASLAYTVVAQPIVVALYGVDAFFIPFRQIAAVVAGPEALTPEYDVTRAAVLGTIVHLIVGIGYALVFLGVARAAGLSSKSGMIAAGVLYGVLIYALNLFVIFPAWFPWFLQNNPWLQVTLHALPFGAVIGWWLARRCIGRLALRQAR